MKKEKKLWETLVSYVLVAAFILSSPFEALAQSNSSRGNLLENCTQLVLRIDENFKARPNSSPS